MPLHKKLTGTDIHQAYAFTFADATARLAGTGYTLTSEDVGKIALQSDNKTFWALQNHSPITWAELTNTTVPPGYTNEEAQDAVGGILADTDTVDFTYDDETPAISAVVKPGSLTDNHVATANKDGVAGTASMRTLGTGAQQSCAGNDSRLSNARTPTAHKSSHVSGGGDAFLSTDVIEAIVKRLQTTTGPTTMTMGAVSDGQFLKRSGTTVVGDTPVGTFGSQFQQVDTDAEITTSSSTFQTAQTLSLTSLPAGTYIIGFYMECGHTNADKVDVRVTIDGDPRSTATLNPETSDGEFTFSGFSVDALSSGNHTILLQYMSTNSTASARARRRRLMIWRQS